jgi:ATP-dependent DNA helicase RecG
METQTTEYKQQWSDKYLAYISGFANAQGGTLYIGINDAGEVVGINNAKYLLENLPNKAIQATGIVPDIEILNKEDNEYIAIHIKPSDQPVSCNGKYYLRSGSTLQELNGNALTDFLMCQTHTTWDMHIEPNATIDDIDPEAVSYFVNFAIDSKRLDESAKHESVEHILRNLKLINKQGQLTFAALMLFGKDIEEYCLSASFRIGRFGATQADLIFNDNIVCPLIRMPEKVMQTLRSRYLVAPVKYEGLRRVEPLEIPEDALREMICNAIVHKDYRGTFIQMRVWNDHIDLWNSGEFPPEITAENLMTTHESHPRNSLIAKVFYLAGFIESWGRGYEKIKDAFEKENLLVPTFEQVRGGVLATIQRERFVTLNKQNGDDSGSEMSAIDQLNDQLKLLQLTDNERKVYYFIKEFDQVNDQLNDQLTTIYIAQKLGVSYSTIKRVLSMLKQKDLVQRVGSKKTGSWKVIK